MPIDSVGEGPVQGTAGMAYFCSSTPSASTERFKGSRLMVPFLYAHDTVDAHVAETLAGTVGQLWPPHMAFLTPRWLYTKASIPRTMWSCVTKLQKSNRVTSSPFY